MSTTASEPKKPLPSVKKPRGKITLIARATCILMALGVVLFIFLSFLLVTQWGNSLIWRQLTYSIKPLDGEFIKGELLNGWTLKNIQWNDQQIQFNAEEAILEWHFAKLLNKELPIQLIRLKSSHLVIRDISKSADERDPESKNAAAIDIPFNLRVDQIYLDEFELESTEADLSIGTLHSQIQLKNNHLTIPELLIDQLQLKLKKPEEKPKATTKTFSLSKGIDLSTSVLPSVQIPLPVTLETFLLTDASLEQGDLRESLSKLELGFSWSGSNISDLSATLSSPKVDAQLSGELQLSDNFPQAISLKATLHDDFNVVALKGINGEKIYLNTSGDLNKLKIKLSAKGVINSELSGNISPLKPHLPMSFKASWNDVVWPFQSDAPKLTSESGSLTIAGDLSQYKLLIDTNLHAIGQPEAHFKLLSNGDYSGLSIQELSAAPATENTVKAIKLTGSINWKSGIQWQGLIQLSNLTPELWLPNWPGALSGSIQSEFSLDFSLENEQWHLQISDLDINGSLVNQPVSAKGNLGAASIQSSSYALPFTARTSGLNLSFGDNVLEANGSLAEKVSLQAKLNAQKLSLLHQDISGQLEGVFKISGSSQHPSFTYAINSTMLNFQQTTVNALNVTGNLTKSDQLKGELNVSAESLIHENIQLKNLSLKASGNESKHSISLKTSGDPVSGNLSINGAWKNNQWKAEVPEALLITTVDQWKLQSPVSIQLDQQRDARVSKQCWLSSPATLCIGDSQLSQTNTSTSFELTDFDLFTLSPLFPNQFNWIAKLSGKGEFHWMDGIPKANARFYTTPGKFTNTPATALAVEYQKLNASLSLDAAQLTAEFDFLSNVLGNAQLNVSVNDIQNKQQLSGTADIENMKLDFLQPLVPSVNQLNGQLSADARMAGTLKSPLLFGKLELKEGNLVTRANALKVSNLISRLTLEGDHGQIDGNLNVGSGEMKLSGNINWQQQPVSGKLTMKGTELEARYPGILQLKASPDLTLNLDETDTLTGAIHIPWARVRVKQLPKQAIKPSDDVVIVTSDSTGKSSQAAPPFAMNVDIILGKDIKLDAYGLKADLAGHLKVNQQPSKPLTGNGSIQLLKGRYHQFGQDLLIKEGDIIFSGPLSNPYLAVNAIQNPDSIEDNVTVGLQVSGPPDRPEFSIYSDPSLPQEEQWSYLLRGYGLKGDDNSAVQAMLISLGVSQFGGVVTTLGEAVGLSDVTLATQGSGDDTQVTIGGTLTPGLRVQYGAGVFNSIGELKVRYELMPRLYLQAISGVAQAVDLFYQFKIAGHSEK